MILVYYEFISEKVKFRRLRGLVRMHFEKITPEYFLTMKPSVPQLKRKKRLPIFGMLDNVRSRYNVGAIFRSCDAALVSELFLNGITPRPPHPAIDKSALGAADVVPWRHAEDGSEFARELKSAGVAMYAVELTRQSKLLWEVPFIFPACLVAGNEVNGISDLMLELCDEAVSLPMLGRANSLNVATAFGVALFELLRQYRARI